MTIDPKHPRAKSLLIREKLVSGLKKGITSEEGLIAHGRGEAFDYLLGEKTHRFALKAIEAAAALLLMAKKPLLSVNGNSCSLAAYEFIKLAQILNTKIEVNLFHYSKKRVQLIENYLRKIDRNSVLNSGKEMKITIPEIASNRKIALRNGIFSSDVILVPLEDGDRTQALARMGKKVIAVDLNPISRTAQSASITIVDNVVRCMPLLITKVRELSIKKRGYWQELIKSYDNRKILRSAYKTILSGLKK